MVHVYGEDEEVLRKVNDTAAAYGEKAKVRAGRGEFIGSQKQDGTDQDQRKDARKVYEGIIGGAEKSGVGGARRVWRRVYNRYGPALDEEVMGRRPSLPAKAPVEYGLDHRIKGDHPFSTEDAIGEPPPRREVMPLQMSQVEALQDWAPPEWFEGQRTPRQPEPAAPPKPAPVEPPKDQGPPPEFTAEKFRAKVKQVEERKAAEKKIAKDLDDATRKEVKRMFETRLTDESWTDMLNKASMAADRGQREYMMLTFPHQALTDGGRAVNAPDPAWPSTLQGLPKEIYDRWAKELAARGFYMGARIIDYPKGNLGNAGLFLHW